MKAVIATLLISWIVTPAMAQGKGRPPANETKADPNDNPAKKRAIEEAYQRALKNIPEPKGKIDPWQGSR